mgnify:CR=1 FL=1
MSMPSTENRAEAATLLARLTDLRQTQPNLYPRDYAAELGVSEAELTPFFFGERVRQLYDLPEVLLSLSRLPRIKLMARVSYAVLEVFSRVDFQRQGGLWVSDVAALFVAIAPSEIAKVFFLSPEKPSANAAILLFDRQGRAALKFYVAPDEFDTALPESNVQALAKAEMTTATALALARTKLVGQFSSTAAVGADNPRRMIEAAASERRQLAFDLETRAVSLLVRHAPAKVVDARGWFNILDADFNLHLKEDAITKTEAAVSHNAQRLFIENAAAEAMNLYALEQK